MNGLGERATGARSGALERPRAARSMRTLGVIVRIALFVAGAVVALGACTDSQWQTRAFSGGAYRFKPGRVDIAQMRASALAASDAQVKYLDDRLQVAVPGESRVYLFTRESNPAHPAVIIMDLVPSVTPFEAYPRGDISKFDAWLLAIGSERDQIVAEYQGKQ